MKTDWQTKKIGDVCSVGAGNSAPQNKDFFIDGKYPFFRTSDIGQIHIGSIDKSIDYLNEKGIRGLKLFPKGTILMPKSGASTFLNHRVVMNVDGYVSSHLATIVTNASILDNKFLFYFLQEIKSQDLIQDHKYPSLNIPVIESIEIPLPPLPKQKRIVKTLEETFKKLEKAKEIAEKNLNNSRDLFNTYLNSIFLNSGKDWDEKAIADVCEVEYGYTEKAKAQGDYRFVRITDTDENGLLTQENKMYVDSFKDVEKYLLNNGDLLMARTGASAGNVLFFESDEKSIFASYLIRMKFDKDVVSKLYWYFSKSKLYWDQVKQLSAGSAQPQFNGGALKKIVLPFPKSLSEQKAIIKKLDQLSKQTKKLEFIYQKKLSAIEELKKSILNKVFSKGL